jgi:hypothetical protein
LSLCKICGETKIVKTSIKLKATSEAFFDEMEETGHGGRDRMIKHLNNGYANISRDCIELFLSLCENCNMKKKHISKNCSHHVL